MTNLLNPPVRRVETVETTPPRLTHADFMRFAPEDAKAELIDGALIIMPPPSHTHKRLQGWLWPDANGELPNTVAVLKELGVL